MLSDPRALVSASEASDYMLHEYLVRNDDAHRTANRWHGRAAAALNLPQRGEPAAIRANPRGPGSGDG